MSDDERAVATLAQRMKFIHGERAAAECMATAFWSEKQGFTDIAPLWQAASEAVRAPGPLRADSE